MLRGINHITLAVSDLDASFNFYTKTLEMQPLLRWDKGAYLLAGDLWLCLALDLDANKTSLEKDYTHISFDVAPSEFESYSTRLLSAGITRWKENSSEGKSLYFLDPDGHKLEIHVGSLNSRLQELKSKPYKGTQWY